MNNIQAKKKDLEKAYSTATNELDDLEGPPGNPQHQGNNGPPPRPRILRPPPGYQHQTRYASRMANRGRSLGSNIQQAYQQASAHVRADQLAVDPVAAASLAAVVDKFNSNVSANERRHADELKRQADLSRQLRLEVQNLTKQLQDHPSAHQGESISPKYSSTPVRSYKPPGMDHQRVLENPVIQQGLQSSGQSASQMYAIAALVKTMNDFEEGEENYTDNFIPPPKMGDKPLLSKTKKDFSGRFHYINKHNIGNHIDAVLTAAKLVIERHQLSEAAGFELLRGMLDDEGMNRMNDALELDIPYPIFWNLIQHSKLPSSSASDIDLQLTKLKFTRPTNIQETLFQIPRLHRDKHAGKNKGLKAALVLEQAADDVKQVISKWYTPYAPPIFAEDARRKVQHNNVLNSNQHNTGGQCYIPCYTLIDIACQKLANVEAMAVITVGGKAIHGIEKGESIEDFLREMPSLPSTLPPPEPKKVEEVEVEEEDEPPLPTIVADSKDIEEMYRQNPHLLTNNNRGRYEQRQSQPQQGYQNQQGYQQPQQGFQRQNNDGHLNQANQANQALNVQLVQAQNKLAQMKQIVQNHEQVRGQLAQLNQVAIPKQPDEHQQLAQNADKVLVENPPFQSARFTQLPTTEREKIPLGYQIDIQPKDAQGKPIKTIPFCFLCARQGHSDILCWTHPGVTRDTTQCAECKGWHPGPCKEWVRENPNKK
jgi:hypothetical protein